MNAPFSKLAQSLFRSKEKNKILDNIRSGEPLNGTEVIIDGITYIVSDMDYLPEVEEVRREIEGYVKNELYQCPYCRSTECDLKDPCVGCETFSKYLNNETIKPEKL